MVSGTVIRKRYMTFNKEYVIGYFLVLYDETYDYGINYNQNLLAFKITSSRHLLQYDVELKKKYAPFLHHNSYVMCSKPMVLLKQDYEILGTITPADLFKVYTTFKRFVSQITEQVSCSVMPALTGHISLAPNELDNKVKEDSNAEGYQSLIES